MASELEKETFFFIFYESGHSKSPRCPNMWSVWLLMSAVTGLSLADFALLIEWFAEEMDLF